MYLHENMLFEMLFRGVKSAYLSYGESYSPLTSHINKAFLPTELPLTSLVVVVVFLTILCIHMLCMKIPRDPQLLKYLSQPVWHQQPRYNQSHVRPHFFSYSNV